MATTPTIFDKALPQWTTEQNQPWGRLKYQLAQANLAKHIGTEPLQILDAGGGNGLVVTLLSMFFPPIQTPGDCLLNTLA